MTAPGVIRFAVLGDSLTEGVGDPLPGGGWRGWAPLLAAGLAPPRGQVRLVNLASSGARTADTARSQLPQARLLRPQLAAVIAGGNDTLRSTFDVGRSARDLDLTIGSLAAQGAVVLTACLPDPGRMLRLPRALARPLARRMGAVNDVVHELSRRHGAVHAHLAAHPMAADPAAWSVDRLHPSELGHRLLATEFHRLLAARGLAAGLPPSLTCDQPAPTRGSCAWWLATRGTRWLAARAADLLPGLLRLALVETRHRLAGTESLLEHTARAATATALRQTAATPPQRHGAAPDPPGLSPCPGDRALGVLD